MSKTPYRERSQSHRNAAAVLPQQQPATSPTAQPGMTTPDGLANKLKAALQRGDRPLNCLWLSLANDTTAELMGGAGFDAVLIDAEHSPNDLDTVRRQVMAVECAAKGATQVVVRTPVNEAWMIKRYLDIGAQSILVPMVNNAADAEAAARAMRFPPEGTRGVAASTRAAAYGRTPSYLTRANEHVCCFVQIEVSGCRPSCRRCGVVSVVAVASRVSHSRALTLSPTASPAPLPQTAEAVANIEAIAAVDGVDCLFVGPSDLAASLGHLGSPGAPEVQAVIGDALRRILAAGKPAGVFSLGPASAREYMALGATFVAVGSDLGLLREGAKALRAQFD